jgi:rare lipoprotein A
VSAPRTGRRTASAALLALLVLGGCAPFPERHSPRPPLASASVPKFRPSAHALYPSVPILNGQTRYEVGGRTYRVLRQDRGYSARGIASWYGLRSIGSPTASGVPYDPFAFTAASKVLPIPSWVEVTNLDNGRHVLVEVDDRGPFVPHRIIDLSYAAAARLGMVRTGTAPVEIRVVDPRTGRPYGPARPRVTGGPPRVYIQLAAYGGRAAALAERARLERLGFPWTGVRRTVVRGRVFYLLRLGPIPTIRALDRLDNRAERTGFLHPEIVITGGRR